MSTHLSCRSRSHRQAFTLIEILVVLAIAAIVSAITLGGFNEMRSGNKRTSCQTNLVQIYQAARQYAADEGGKFPYYQDACPTGTPSGIGLWSLYTFPNANYTAPAAPGSKPIERYVRSAKVLHCPSDAGKDTLDYSNMNLYSSDKSEFNLNYLSYQACDGAVPTYQTTRDTTPDTPSNDPLWKRQLINRNGTSLVSRPPADDTVVSWCMHHRNPRNLDNVLFYDGSVQLIARDYGGVDEGWKRLPKPPQ